MDTLGPFVEIGRKGEFRYSVEVRPIAPAPRAGIRCSAKPTAVSKLWGGQVPATVEYPFLECQGGTRDEAVERARASVKGWIDDGAPGSE